MFLPESKENFSGYFRWNTDFTARKQRDGFNTRTRRASKLLHQSDETRTELWAESAQAGTKQGGAACYQTLLLDEPQSSAWKLHVVRHWSKARSRVDPSVAGSSTMETTQDLQASSPTWETDAQLSHKPLKECRLIIYCYSQVHSLVSKNSFYSLASEHHRSQQTSENDFTQQSRKKPSHHFKGNFLFIYWQIIWIRL